MAIEERPIGEPIWLNDEELKFRILESVHDHARVGTKHETLMERAKVHFHFVKKFGVARPKQAVVKLVKKEPERGPFRSEPSSS